MRGLQGWSDQEMWLFMCSRKEVTPSKDRFHVGVESGSQTSYFSFLTLASTLLGFNNTAVSYYLKRFFRTSLVLNSFFLNEEEKKNWREMSPYVANLQWIFCHWYSGVIRDYSLLIICFQFSKRKSTPYCICFVRFVTWLICVGIRNITCGTVFMTLLQFPVLPTVSL